MSVYCDYCGREAELVDSKIIHGRSFGMAYLCRHCLAYVGCHRGTTEPLGRLANAELRYWKQAAHQIFDPLWRFGMFKGDRPAAYRWLADQMGIPEEKTHIGLFDIEQCKQAIEVINNYLGKGETNG